MARPSAKQRKLHHDMKKVEKHLQDLAATARDIGLYFTGGRIEWVCKQMRAINKEIIGDDE